MKLGANDRVFRTVSEKAINIWTYAEMGEKLAKKLHKRDMRKHKRNKEKQDLRKEVKESLESAKEKEVRR